MCLLLSTLALRSGDSFAWLLEEPPLRIEFPGAVCEVDWTTEKKG